MGEIGLLLALPPPLDPAPLARRDFLWYAGEYASESTSFAGSYASPSPFEDADEEGVVSGRYGSEEERRCCLGAGYDEEVEAYAGWSGNWGRIGCAGCVEVCGVAWWWVELHDSYYVSSRNTVRNQGETHEEAGPGGAGWKLAGAVGVVGEWSDVGDPGHGAGVSSSSSSACCDSGELVWKRAGGPRSENDGEARSWLRCDPASDVASSEVLVLDDCRALAL